MKFQHLKIPIEEYLQMQQPFGYKVEYYDGEAIFQPQALYIDGHLTLKPQESQLRYRYQAVNINHQQAMTRAFFNAFQDTVEFCNWPEDDIHKHAKKNIDDYFSGVRGEPSCTSKLLLDQKGAITALALFITTKLGKTKLDLLFVLPESQYTGIATEIVTLASNELYKKGIREIYSSWHALNEASQNWHHKFGFTDVYEQYFIQRKHSWYQREIKRLESNDVTEGIQELTMKKNHWYNLLDEEWKSYTHN